jgi:hypothetical protein
LPQEPDNLSSLRAAKNKTDTTQKSRSLQSSGTDARKIQKRNASSACCRKSLLVIISDRCGRQKTRQMPLKNAATCNRAEQMHDNGASSNVDKSKKETLLPVVAKAR